MKKIFAFFAALALPLAAHAAYYSYSPTEVQSFSIEDSSYGSTYEYTINIEQRGKSGSWYNSTTTIYLTPKTHSFVGEFNIGDGTLSQDSYVYYDGATRKFISSTNNWSTDNKTTLSITANADGTYTFGGTVICKNGSNIYRYLFTDYIYDPFASEPAQGTVSVTAENITAYDYIKSDGYVELDLISTEGPHAALGFINSTFNIPAGTYNLDASGNPGTFIASNGMDGYYAMPSYVESVGWPAEDYFLCSGTITVSYSNGNMTVSGTATSAHGSVITINATGASPFPPEINCLCFTANTSNSTVQLNKVGNPYEATLEYSTTETTWVPYTFGQTITLTDAGDKVYFRNAGEGVASGFSNSFTDYYQFVMSGSIAASGNVMSLIDNTCKSTSFPANGAYCFACLFSGCESLTSAPELPAMTLAQGCYYWMFNGCTGLTSAPELPAMTLAYGCYQAMYDNCTGLKQVPALPATTMETFCYAAMFRGCTSLTEAPELSATTLKDYCYSEMFSGCTSLETAPELPVTTLQQSCYDRMFYGCTSLTTAPELPATTLPYRCYDQMFSGCTKLSQVKVAFTKWTDNTTYNWLKDVASTGTFVCPDALDKSQTGASYIPEGWTPVYEVKANNEPETENYYATFYSKENAYQVPEGVTAYTGVAEGNVLNLTPVADGIIPADEPVILKATQSQVYLPYTTETGNKSASNKLLGTDEETTLGANDYALSLGQYGVGFYLWSGKSIGANKAYLTLENPTFAKAFTFQFEDEITGIDDPQLPTLNSQPTYNLNGMRVNDNYKGIVIKNGKKIYQK